MRVTDHPTEESEVSTDGGEVLLTEGDMQEVKHGDGNTCRGLKAKGKLASDWYNDGGKRGVY